jgi:hypothetical protein
MLEVYSRSNFAATGLGHLDCGVLTPLSFFWSAAI